MAASLGNLDLLLNLSGPLSDLYGVTVPYHTDIGLIPTQTLGAVTAKTNGAPGPGGALLTPNQNGQQQLFTVTAVNDLTNAITLLITVGGVGVANLTEYVLAFYPSAILYGTVPSVAAARTLDQGITASGTLGIISLTPLAVGSQFNFLSTYTYVGPSPVTYAIAAANATKAEGNSGATPFTFFVTRTGDTSQPASFTYAVNGSGQNPATADDFVGGALPHGTVSFAPGDRSETIVANVQGDTTVEQDETFSVTLTGGPPGADVTTAIATGTIINDDAPPHTTALLGYYDSTLQQAGTITMDPASAGGPGYLQSQYIYGFNDSFAFSTSAPNVFIHGGSGDDAIQVTSGQNVLDGGLGSNFLTGGSGSGTDTFFTDARSAGVVWNTIRNFHAGDAATLWGFTAGVSSYYWEPQETGAAGSEGATLRANIVGGSGRIGNGIDASITFTGLSVQQAQSLEVVTGSQPAGNYLFIYNPGV